jgi:hypothetical protein
VPRDRSRYSEGTKITPQYFNPPMKLRELAFQQCAVAATAFNFLIV